MILANKVKPAIYHCSSKQRILSENRVLVLTNSKITKSRPDRLCAITYVLVINLKLYLISCDARYAALVMKSPMKKNVYAGHGVDKALKDAIPVLRDALSNISSEETKQNGLASLN